MPVALFWELAPISKFTVNKYFTFFLKYYELLLQKYWHYSFHIELPKKKVCVLLAAWFLTQRDWEGSGGPKRERQVEPENTGPLAWDPASYLKKEKKLIF